MTATQLMDVGFADKIVSKALIDGMSQGLPYKEVYKLAKERILIIAELHGKSDVIDHNLLIID